MRILLISSLTLVLFASTAFAQNQHYTGENANTTAAKQDSALAHAKEAEKKQQEIDAAYKAALERTKAPVAAPSDPWAGVRSGNNSAAK
jgi:hypothetical protein